jgi:hypothetical protein
MSAGTHTLEAIVRHHKGYKAHCSCGHETSEWASEAATRIAFDSHASWNSRAVNRSTSPEAAIAAKREGQQLSLLDATDSDEDVTRAAILKIAPGDDFTANDLREAWDLHDVATKSRGGLIAKAVATGLCEPVTHYYRGKHHPIRIASTGDTANSATVVVYRRLAPTSTPPREVHA